VLSTYTFALFCHLLGVLLLTSGIVLAAVAFETARRRDDPAEIALILGLSRVGVLLVAPGGLLVLGFGLWLVHLGGFGFDAFWVSAALGLFVVALGLGAVGGQRPKQARLLATRLAAQDAPLDAQLRALLDDGMSRAANYLSALSLLAILALMVFKP
jgi:uncharacterized membrane protein